MGNAAPASVNGQKKPVNGFNPGQKELING